jgi:hypothetical protein
MPNPKSLLLLAGLCALLAACGGAGRNSGDRAGTENWRLTITPSAVTLLPGQSIQFSASSPWGGSATWSAPAAAGSFSGDGRFTASTTPGVYTIVAAWNRDVRYTALAKASVLPAPPPAATTPDLAPASGGQQNSADGTSAQAVVVGEPVSVAQAEGPGGDPKLRHGFALSVQ